MISALEEIRNQEGRAKSKDFSMDNAKKKLSMIKEVLIREA